MRIHRVLAVGLVLAAALVLFGRVGTAADAADPDVAQFKLLLGSDRDSAASSNDPVDVSDESSGDVDSDGNNSGLKDRIALQDRISDYAYAFDGKDANRFASLFAENGILELGAAGGCGAGCVGRAAIRDWAANRFATVIAGVTTHHNITNVKITKLTSTRAKVDSYLLLSWQRVSASAFLQRASGYKDTLMKNDGKWEILRRTLVPSESRRSSTK